MWENLKNIFGGFYLPQITIMDMVEIAIIVCVLYYFIKSIQNTRTMLLIKALCILFVVYFAAEICNFSVITSIFQVLAIVLILASIIIFQPELRKALEKIGSTEYKTLRAFFKRRKKKKSELYFSDETISGLCDAAFSLSETKTGALIVIEKDIPLNEYVDTGIKLNADLSSALLINIFEKNTPLHDGAIVVKENKIIAGTCYLPLSDNPAISKKLGTRHRAAIGITETSDCFVVVVSEETGGVSFIEGGVITKCKTKEALLAKLKEKQIKKTVLDKKIKWTNNWAMKLFVLFAGFSTWLIMMNSLDPVVTLKIEDVPIVVVNEKVLESVGKTYEITSDATVDVYITDVRSVAENITKNDVIVTADLSKLSLVYSVPLSADVRNNSTQVEFADDEVLTITVDSIVAKEFALTLTKVGEANSEYYVSKITSATDGIVVTGAESLINIIDKVEFFVDVSGAKENFTQTVKPVIYDKNGKILDLSMFSLSKNSIVVSAELLNTKTIPVNITLAGLAEDAEYELSIAKYEPYVVKIAAEDDVLSNIYDLNIEVKTDIQPSDIINTTFQKEINIKDYLPDNVYCADVNSKIDITINYKPYEVKVITFTTDDICIEGLSRQNTVFIEPTTLQVEIAGPHSLINEIGVNDLLPYIDVKDLKNGTYDLPILFKNLNNVKIKTETINVAIKIENKK